jgi:hypothetical protein
MTAENEDKTIRMLIDQYYGFMARFDVDLGSYKFDAVTLKDIARRYWRDVERIMAFHDIKSVDCHKVGGYLTYWITKLKPISVADNKIYLRNAEPPLFINELFALYVAVGRINYHLKVIGSDRVIIYQ